MSRTTDETQRAAEQAFLASYDEREFDRPSVTVDVALLTLKGGMLRVLLVKRRDHPERGKWALPGGFVQMGETLDAAAERVLRSKVGLARLFLEQLFTFGDPHRDPRTRVITVAYYALVDQETLGEPQSDDSLALGQIEVPWEGEVGGAVLVRDVQGQQLPLAFDHDQILGMAVKRIRGKLNYTPIGFQLLPESFTLRQLQEVHETILGQATNKDSFRRRMLASGMLEAVGGREGNVGHRPAGLYRFSKRSAI
jgi:8-oxo-dGTP diphosphatase